MSGNAALIQCGEHSNLGYFNNSKRTGRVPSGIPHQNKAAPEGGLSIPFKGPDPSCILRVRLLGLP